MLIDALGGPGVFGVGADVRDGGIHFLLLWTQPEILGQEAIVTEPKSADAPVYRIRIPEKISQLESDVVCPLNGELRPN